MKNQNDNAVQSLRWQRSRVDMIRHELIEIILESRLAPGDLIPTEASLATQLGVSRNSLREGIKSLQALGIVEIRHGHGTFMAERSFSALSEVLAFGARQSILTGSSEARELIEVREALETGLLAKAIEHITDRHITEALRAVDEMEALARQGRPAGSADARFHSVLFEAIDNQLLTEVLRAFWTAYDQLSDAVTGGPTDPVETAQQHRQIIEAVIDGDVDVAAERMREHFVDIRIRVDEAIARSGRIGLSR